MEKAGYSDFQSKILSESQKVSQWKVEKEFELNRKIRQLADAEEEIARAQQKVKHYQELCAKFQSKLSEERESREELNAKIHHCKCVAAVFETQMKDASAFIEKLKEEVAFYKKRHDIVASVLNGYEVKLATFQETCGRLEVLARQKVDAVQMDAEKRIEEANLSADRRIEELILKSDRKIEEMQKSVEIVLGEKDTLESQARKSEGKIASLLERTEKFESFIKSLEKDLEDARSYEKDLKFELEKTICLCQEKDAELVDVKEKLTAVGDEFSKVKSEAENLLVCLEAADHANKELTEKEQLNQVMIIELKAELEDERQQRIKAEEVRDEIAEAKQVVEDNIVEALNENLGLNERLQDAIVRNQQLAEEKNELFARVTEIREKLVEIEFMNVDKDRLVAELQDGIDRLSSENVTYKDQSMTMSALIDQLHSELSVTKQKLTEVESKLSETESACTDKDGLVAELRGAIDRLSSESVTYKDQSTSMRALIDQLHSELSVTKQKLTEVQNELSETESACTGKDGLVAELQDAIDRLSSENATYKDQTMTVSALIDQLHSELSVTKQKLTEVQNKLSETESANSGKDGLVAELQDNIDRLSSENATYKDQSTSMSALIDQLHSELSVTKQKLTEVQSKLLETESVSSGKDRLVTELQDGINRLSSENATFNDQRMTMSALIDQLHSELSVTKQAFSEVQSRLSETESVSSGKDRLVTELQDGISRLNREIATFKDQSMTMSALIDQLHSELSVTKQKLTEVQSKLSETESANSGKDGLVAELQDNIDRLSSENATYKDQKMTMSALIDQLHSELSVTKQAFSEVQSKLSETGSASSGKDKVIEELRLQLQRLNAESADFKEKNESLKAEDEKVRLFKANVNKHVDVPAGRPSLSTGKGYISLSGPKPAKQNTASSAEVMSVTPQIKRPLRLEAMKTKNYAESDDSDEVKTLDDSADSTRTVISKKNPPLKPVEKASLSQQSAGATRVDTPKKFFVLGRGRPSDRLGMIGAHKSPVLSRAEAAAIQPVAGQRKPPVIASGAAEMSKPGGSGTVSGVIQPTKEQTAGKRKLLPKRQETFSDHENNAPSSNETVVAKRSVYDLPDLYDSPPREHYGEVLKSAKKPMKGFRFVKRKGFRTLNKKTKDEKDFFELFD